MLSHRYGILIAMTGAFAMTMLDNSIVSIAMPYIQGDLDTSKELLIWIFNAYILTFAACVAICGRLGDVYGPVRLFVYGILLFTLASILCGLAPTGEVLVLARILQAVGAAMMQPTSIAIVFHTFEKGEIGKAMSVYVGIGLAFLAMGPIVGGFLTSFLTWRWIFYINVPIGLIALFMLYIYRPETSKQTHVRIDRYGIVLILLALPLLVLPFQEASSWGLFSLKTLGVLALGLFFLIWFYRHEKKHPDPILDVFIFHDKLFVLYSFVLCSATFALFSSSVFNSLYLQNVLGFEPYKAGFYLLYILIPNILIGLVIARIYDRIGLSWLAVIGAFFMAISFMGLAYSMAQKDLNVIILFYIVSGIGTGMIMSPLNAEMMRFAPKEKMGQISGLLQTLRLLGGTVGVALLSSIILFHEEKLLKPVIMKFNIKGEHLEILNRLLSEPADERAQLAAKVSQTPGLLLNDLSTVAADSISRGFMMTSIFLFIGMILSVFAYRMAKNRVKNI